MTLLHKEWISCPECLHEEDTTIWDRISVQSDPDLKEEVLRKKLQLFHCNQCQAEYVLDKSFLYTDEEKDLFLLYAPKFKETLQQQEKESLEKILDSILPANDNLLNTKNYKYKIMRLCLNYNDLIEKIHLADHSFDDRLMEIIKLAIKSRVKEEENKDILKMYFVTGNEQSMIFQVQYDNETIENLELSTALYINAENTLLQDLVAKEGLLLIDEDYALNFIKEKGQKQ